MSLNIKLKHSAVASKKPQVSDLQPGELALNINNASPAGYALDDAGAVQQMFGKATESQSGQLPVATDTQAKAGADDATIITPLKLESVIADERTANDSKFVDAAGDTMTGALRFNTTSNTGIAEGTAPKDSTYLTSEGGYRNQTDSGTNILLSKTSAITTSTVSDGDRRFLNCKLNGTDVGGMILRKYNGSNWFDGQASFEGNFHGGLSETERIWNQRPSNFWSESDYIGVGTSTAGDYKALGGLTTSGSFGVSLCGNGYRNDSGGWSSFSSTTGQSGGTEISLAPSGSIVFYSDTNKSSATQKPTERAKINNSGLTISNLTGSGNRAVYSTSGGTLTNSSSDATLKTNVQTLSPQVDVVKSLNPVSFNWIDTALRGAQPEIGFIAQQVQELVPEVVGSNSDGTLTVDYPKMVATLTKALQECIARIEDLEARAKV